MAYSSFLAHEKEQVKKYISELILNTKRYQLKSQDHLAQLTTGTLKRLKQFKYLDTNPREVEHRIERLIEKFTVHNQLEKAERLKALVALFRKKSLSNTYGCPHHNILRLLINLSKDNLTKSVLLDDTILKRASKVRLDRKAKAEMIRKLIVEDVEKSESDKDSSEDITGEDTEEDDNEEFDKTTPIKRPIQEEKAKTTENTKSFLQSQHSISKTQIKLTSPAGNGDNSIVHGHKDPAKTHNVFFGGFPTTSLAEYSSAPKPFSFFGQNNGTFKSVFDANESTTLPSAPSLARSDTLTSELTNSLYLSTQDRLATNPLSAISSVNNSTWIPPTLGKKRTNMSVDEDLRQPLNQ